MKQHIAYFVFQDKTAFIPLKFVYPECMIKIKDKPQLFPLKCFVTDACPAGSNCGETLVKRIHYLFEHVVPSSNMIISYFKWHDKPNSLRGAVFGRDLEPPRLITMNPYAFTKFKKEGTPYKWFPSDEYSFMGGSEGIVSVDNLVKV